VAPRRQEKASRITLGAETGQAVARHERNLLVETAERIVAEFLAERGFALAGPVSAQLRTTPEGSTGVDVRVRLGDPGDAEVVQAAIDEHFGGDGVDVLRIS
jgi:hypothetical protein